jgi:hypothetical protein
LKILSDQLNIHVGYPNIDPTKEEFTTPKSQATHMFQDNHHPHFEDHNSWHHFPKANMNKFDDLDPSGWVTQM